MALVPNTAGRGFHYFHFRFPPKSTRQSFRSAAKSIPTISILPMMCILTDFHLPRLCGFPYFLLSFILDFVLPLIAIFFHSKDGRGGSREETKLASTAHQREKFKNGALFLERWAPFLIFSGRCAISVSSLKNPRPALAEVEAGDGRTKRGPKMPALRPNVPFGTLKRNFTL